MILLTGGTGVLGTALQALLPGVVAPPRSELDITDASSVERAVQAHYPDVIVHAAAFTDVRRAEVERELAWATNVVGTRNVARAARATGALLVHISTDYVFSGTPPREHGFSETDAPGPVVNYYSLTKLAAEEAAWAHDDALVLRTSFRPNEWPYDVAYTDMTTSQDYIDVIAPLIAEVITHVERVPVHTLHVATEAKSVFELAKRRAPHVQPGLRADAPVVLPANVVLNSSLFHLLRKGFHDEHNSDPPVTPWSDAF